MNDVLAQSPPGTTTNETPRPRRHRWRWVAIVMVLLVAVTAIGGIITIARYRPLESGARFHVWGADIVERRGSSRNVFLVYEHGDEFQYSFDLRNDGPWGITVTEIELTRPSGDDYVFALEQLQVRMGSPENSLSDRPSVPFEPFSLGPGESRMIVIRARFWDCGSIGDSGFYFDFETVHYRVLGIRKTMDVRPARTLVISSQDVASCPPKPALVNEGKS